MVASSRSPRRFALSLLFAGVALAIGGAAACGLSTEGVPDNGCKLDVDCVLPSNPCKVGACSSGRCAFKALPDGPPTVQVPGDCQFVTCSGGEVVTEIDATDVDDDNPCTIDSCAADGTPEHTKVEDGTACETSGLCMDGTCIVSCERSEDCPEKTCKSASCDLTTKQCAYTPLHGTPISNVSPDDCVETVCVNGNPTAVPNDTEKPVDQLCHSATCSGGVATYTPLPEGTPCGALECDGMGNCVGCTDASDCEVQAPCQEATCDAGICNVHAVPFGTYVEGLNTGDCKQLVCNGFGGTIVVADPNDIPLDFDPDDCQAAACSGDQPSFQPLPTGSACQGCVQTTCQCSATGLCVDCLVDSDCGPPPVCHATSCQANECITYAVPDGSDPYDHCSPSSNDPCGTDGECDGNGACRLAPQTTVCAPASCTCSGNASCAETPVAYCDGAGQCTSVMASGCGAYKCDATGTACSITCSSNNDCIAGMVCGPTGQCGLPNGSPCGPTDCASGYCVDNVCCESSGCPPCKNCQGGSCNGNDPLGTQECPAGQVCDDAGACKLANGQNCMAPEDCASGHCCGAMGMKKCQAGQCP